MPLKERGLSFVTSDTLLLLNEGTSVWLRDELSELDVSVEEPRECEGNVSRSSSGGEIESREASEEEVSSGLVS